MDPTRDDHEKLGDVLSQHERRDEGWKPGAFVGTIIANNTRPDGTSRFVLSCVDGTLRGFVVVKVAETGARAAYEHRNVKRGVERSIVAAGPEWLAAERAEAVAWVRTRASGGEAPTSAKDSLARAFLARGPASLPASMRDRSPPAKKRTHVRPRGRG
jgi:hypothetical protein